MKRTDIKAGVVYAVKSSYGAPSPIVFLEDKAAGIYSRGAYGRGGISKLDESIYKAQRGRGWSETTKGYAAITGAAGALDALAAVDPARELERFIANERPSADDLEFSIRYTLSDISGLYAEEMAAYDAAEAARHERDRRVRDERNAAFRRRRAIIGALDDYGIGAQDNSAGKVELSLDEADKLLALLAAKPDPESGHLPREED